MSILLNFWWFIGLLTSIPAAYLVGNIVGRKSVKR